MARVRRQLGSANRRLLFAAIAVIVCGLGAATRLRSSWWGGPEAMEERASVRAADRAARLGQDAFRAISMRPLGSISSLPELRVHLSDACGTPRESRSAAKGDIATASVVGLTAEFIYHRFMQDSPEVYRAWRVSSGYRMKDSEAMRREGVPKDHEDWFGEPYPGDERLVDVFDRLWVATMGARDERSRPVGIAQDAAGVEVALGEMDRAWERPMPTLSGELPEGAWQGLRSGRLGRDWWHDPSGGIHAELQHRASVPVAVVGVIVEMKMGDRYPFTFTYYRDGKGRWWLWRVNVLNSPLDRFVQIEI